MIQDCFFKETDYQLFTDNHKNIHFPISVKEKRTEKNSFLWLMLFIFALLFNNTITAQTTLISPTGDGGFETGATFATNGWTATTGISTQNQWVCNTGATAGFSGTRSAYITNNTAGTPPPHTYTNNVTLKSHLYRNVTIPAGESVINLNLSYICRGENNYDYLRIWKIPTGTTPVYGTAIIVSASNVMIAQISSQTTWKNTTYSLPTNLAGTSFRLVFEWSNDASAGTNPPAAVDNISLTSQSIINDICSGAISLTPGTTCTPTTGSTTGATDNNETGDCTTGTENAVWYKFTAAYTTQFVTVDGAAGFRPVTAAISTCGTATVPSGGACVSAAADDGIASMTLSGLTVGNAYYVQVHDFNGDLTANGFTICITNPAPNDTCATALTLTPNASCAPTTGSTLGASDNNETGDCTNGTGTQNAVWYKFTATFTTHYVTVDGATGFDSVIGAISTCGTTTRPTGGACTDATGNGGIESMTLTGLTIGNTYYVQIHDYYGVTMTDAFTICITNPPVNDACANAIALTVNPSNICTVSTTGTTVNASQSLAGCSGTADDDVWYSFVATGTSHIITVTPSTLYDPVFQVFSGTCASATSLGCVQNSFAAAGIEEAIATSLTIGTTYLIRVYGYYSGSTYPGSFTICITSPPINNDCSGAIALTVNPDTVCTTSTSGTTVAASQSTAGCSGTADDDVWYSFVATGTSHIVTVTPSTLTDAVFQVYSGACAGLSSIVCRDATSGTAIETSTLTGLTIGATYRVRVYSYNSGSTYQGAFTICITTPVAPINDSCANATNLPCGTVNMAGTSVNATTESPGTGCTPATNSCGVWYTFTGDGYTTTISSVASFDHEMAIVSGSCGAKTAITCVDAAASGGTETYTFTSVAGTNYYIYIAHYLTGATTGTFTISRSCIAPPSNDNCTGATPLTVNTSCSYTTGTNVNATTSTTPSTPPAPGCATYSGGDVWYSFVVPASGAVTVDTQASGITDSGIALYSGTCGALTLLKCDDDSSTGNMSQINATGLTPGATLYVRVWEKGNNVFGTFGICITEYVPVYCAPTTATANGLYIDSVSFVGTLNDVSNTSTYTGGYQNFSTLAGKAKQAQGEGVNLIANSTPSRGRWKVWVDWNKDGVFADDFTETVYDTGIYLSGNVTFGYIIPASTNPGLYSIRLRVRNSNSIFGEDSGDFTPCENFTGNYIGEAEDYQFEVVESCPALITSVIDGETCGTGAVNLSVTGTSDTTAFYWYTTLTGGSPVATTTTGDWTTPSLSSTTTYYVTAYNDSCESLERTAVIAKISPTPTLSFNPSTPTVCGENSIVTLSASGDKETVFLIDEDFESGLGVFTATANTDLNSATIDADTKWQNKTSTTIPNGEIWYPAISSGFGADKFALANSDPNSGPPPSPVENSLALTTAVSTASFLNLTLKLNLYFSRYLADGDTSYTEDVTLQVSTNGGGAWTDITQLTAETGIGTKFQALTYNLDAYINQPNLKIRIRHRAYAGLAGWLPGGVAVDDVKLYGERPLNTAFTWTSSTTIDAFEDLACTIPYNSGTSTVTTVYVRPTLAQLASGNFTFTATATLSNRCSVSQPIAVTNNSKIWQTTASTDWNTASNWLPSGVPAATNCVIIPNHSIISGSGYDAYAKNLTIKPTGLLDLQSNNNLTVTDWVNVDASGVFNVKNNASLIQVNNTTNTVAGTFNMERISQPMNALDYTYWGSPITQASGFTLGNLSPNSPLLYEWIPSVSNASGNWSSTPLSTVMKPGKGYIARAPNNSILATYTANFTGSPNNGNVTMPITYGTLGASTNDNWNFISNPYPSAINTTTFLNLASNIPVIGGTIYLWTHNTAPLSSAPDPFYGDYVYNYTANDYASWNLTGGVGTAATSGGGIIPNGYIAAGSGFFVKSLEVAGSATFTNAMRVSNYNNQFFKNANPTTNTSTNDDNLERHRIWLNLTSSNAFSQILVGYVEGATEDLDRNFDGTRFGGIGLTFYSILPEDKLGIQGRSLPFNDTDLVPLGFNAAVAGPCSIRIDHLDGLFDNQNIYLQDNLLNITHDLKKAPYEFSTEAGTFNDRFVLRYTEKILGTNNFDLNDTIKIVVDEKVTVHSSNLLIKNIDVFDLLGRKIDHYENVNSKQFTLSHLSKILSTLILHITLEDDIIVSQKILY